MSQITQKTENSINWVCPICGSTSYNKIFEIEEPRSMMDISNLIFTSEKDTGFFSCNGCSVMFVHPDAFNKNKG